MKPFNVGMAFNVTVAEALTEQVKNAVEKEWTDELKKYSEEIGDRVLARAIAEFSNNITLVLTKDMKNDVLKCVIEVKK